MILLDTNVVIDAHYGDRKPSSSCQELDFVCGHRYRRSNKLRLRWLNCTLAQGAVRKSSRTCAKRASAVLDLPAGAAAICGRAYRRYRLARTRSGGGKAPSVPLPDFFIGAHAELMGWKLATRDVERYRIYFPAVELIEPATVS